MRRIRHSTTVAITALAVLAVACADAAGPEGPGDTAMCVGAVRVSGTSYSWLSHDSGLPEGSQFDQVYATVQAYTGCNDVVIAPDTPDPGDNILDDGESNFLPAGTDLYVIPGHPPSERLAAWFEGMWIVVIAG